LLLWVRCPWPTSARARSTRSARPQRAFAFSRAWPSGGQRKRNRAEMKITIIGQSTCIPDHEHEAACALIDGKHLVDTGWCSAQVMRAYGFDPLALESILLTHLHQDHYLGLPALLFYHGLRGQGDPSP